MSFFSKSSKGSHYKNGNHGSNHYQKKGFLGSLLNVICSRSNSRGYNNQYPQQESNQHGQNQQSSNQNTLFCIKCNSPIPTGSKFCLECGEKVNDIMFCMNCREKLPPNAKFCTKCGTKLNG